MVSQTGIERTHAERGEGGGGGVPLDLDACHIDGDRTCSPGIPMPFLKVRKSRNLCWNSEEKRFSIGLMSDLGHNKRFN